jgi:hypothetical protein
MKMNYYNYISDHFLVKDESLFKFGSIGDGGYYLRPKSLKNSKLLLSGGISSNLEFEYDAFRFNDSLKIIMVDPTISSSKLIIKGFLRLFLKKPEKIKYLINTLIFIYLKRQSRCKHLKIWLNKPKSLFGIVKRTFQIETNILLKLDIEGSEYYFLEEIIQNLDKISAMVFEFHEVHKNHERLISFIKDCSTKFNLVYISINVAGGFEGENRPKCLELSFEKIL